MQSFPILRYLTPDFSVIVPDGHTLIDEPITKGLPYVMSIDANISLVLALATGDAALWRDADPRAIVSQSQGAWFEPDKEHPVPHAPPMRLLARVNGRLVSATALVAAQPHVFDLPSETRRFEFIVLSWDIRAGSLRDEGDYGSNIRLVWRWIDQAVSQYSTPPIMPSVEIRQPPKDRTESKGKFSEYLQLEYKYLYSIVPKKMSKMKMPGVIWRIR
jgi:hypothetical protein